MFTWESEYASVQEHIPKNRKKILILTGLLVMILLLGAAHPVRAAEPTICLGACSSIDSVSATKAPWTLTICPADEINALPDDPDQVFTITLNHTKDVGDPSCESKDITVTTTFGEFRDEGSFFDNGISTLVVKTDKSCTFTATVFSYSPGHAVITARKSDEKNGVTVSTNMTWAGTTASPSFIMDVTSDPFLANGEDATFAIDVNNTGNVTLDYLTVMVGLYEAGYVSGDDGDNKFEPLETWHYAYSTPVSMSGSTTFDIQAEAWYKTHPLYQNTSVTYTRLLIGKLIPVERFNEAYQDLPFNVTAQMAGNDTIYGPFGISVLQPSQIAVINTTWNFTEESQNVIDPFSGTFVPAMETLTYRPGDPEVLYFENTLEYLQVLVTLNLTEHEVEMNLSAGETDHTLYAVSIDQYGEPIPNLNVTFADSAYNSANVFTNESGIAEYTYSSSVPDNLIVNAFVDADNDTYFDGNEIGDSCVLTWSYVPLPASLTVQGMADVTNYLDYEQFGHIFNLTLTDQYGRPMNSTRVNFTVDYENGTDVASFGLTDANGVFNIPVYSTVPDVAHITAEIGAITASMNKTWTYEIPPTTLTFIKTAEDVNGGMLVVGDTIQYTLIITNTGSNPAYFVNVTDDLPDFVTCKDIGGDSEDCADPYVWNIGQINPGSAVSLTINVTIDAEAAGQSVINTGTIEGRNFPSIDPLPAVCLDGSQPEDGNCVSTPVAVTTLSLTKTAVDLDGGYLVTGDIITYTLTVTNTGNSPAYEVVVTDDLPDTVTCQDVAGTPASCNDTVIWYIGELAAGAYTTLTINVSIDADAAGQSIINTGQVTGGNVDPVDPAQVCPDGSAPAGGICLVAPIPPDAVPTTFSFAKTAEDVNGGELVIGDLIRYTLMVSNTGTNPAYNVLVTDDLPDLLACEDVDGDSEDCAGVILWYIGQLQPGATATLTINTTILPEAEGQSIVNTGLVSGDNVIPVDPVEVCPDGSLPVGDICIETPVKPEVPKTDSIPQTKPSHSGSHGSYSIIYHPPQTLTSDTCGPDEHYVEGKGCVLCAEDEVFIEGTGCVKNETPVVFEEPPIPSSSASGNLLTLIIYPLLILILALLAALFIIWWRRRQQEETPSPGSAPGGEMGGVTATDAAYASIIRVINEIDGQLAALERGIRTAGSLSTQEATKVAESFFYTSQLAESVMKDPEIRKQLSGQQLAQLQHQLEISVQKMHALSRQSETLLNAMQMQYVQAQV
jgi:uncharacterized repeat protein (TIGR01451 family)